jgi:hypothetical protein
MLSDDEKERIRAQEEFRHAIQHELQEAAGKSKPSSALERLLSSDNVRWIATTVAIPLTVGGDKLDSGVRGSLGAGD